MRIILPVVRSPFTFLNSWGVSVPAIAQQLEFVCAELRAELARQGLARAEFAKLISCSPAYVSMMTHGLVPSPEIQSRIVDVLGLAARTICPRAWARRSRKGTRRRCPSPA